MTAAAAPLNPMHRTDIEGFGHYEDRREMELTAGSIGGPALATTAATGSSMI
jgi:hypothetical protein